MKPEKLPEDRLLTNLIEECGELVQAAAKLKRVKIHDTPVTEAEARKHLIEEMADVKLCIEVLTSRMEDAVLKGIMRQKYERWCNRVYDEEA